MLVNGLSDQSRICQSDGCIAQLRRLNCRHKKPHARVSGHRRGAFRTGDRCTDSPERLQTPIGRSILRALSGLCKVERCHTAKIKGSTGNETSVTSGGIFRSVEAHTTDAQLGLTPWRGQHRTRCRSLGSADRSRRVPHSRTLRRSLCRSPVVGRFILILRRQADSSWTFALTAEIKPESAFLMRSHGSLEPCCQTSDGASASHSRIGNLFQDSHPRPFLRGTRPWQTTQP